MIKHIHKISELEKLFEKLKYENEKYWAIYSAMMFELKKEEHLKDFEHFLLKHLRITDSIFSVSKDRVLVILEETTIRWVQLLSNDLKNKIKKKELKYKYYSSAIQWNYIESEKKLLKSLKKRLKIAKEEDIKECIFELDH